MKIGVLATGYNCSEYFDEVMGPWLQYKEKHGDLIISTVNAHFNENGLLQLDDSKELMLHAFNTKKFDYLSIPHGSFNEAEARNLALQPLLQEKCDIIWLLDFDEIYTLEEIEGIVKFVKNNPFTSWFKIHFKNYVFDEKHYVDDFCPPRIFNVTTEDLEFRIDKFYFDNDLNYIYSKDGNSISYKDFSSMKIPRAIAFITHYSWCGSPERLKEKIKYQLAHFEGICSYKWDNENDKLILDLDFYKKYNVPVPTIYEDKILE